MQVVLKTHKTNKKMTIEKAETRTKTTRIEDRMDSPPGLSFMIQRDLTLSILRNISGINEDEIGPYRTLLDIDRFAQLRSRRDRTPVNQAYSRAMRGIHRIVQKGRAEFQAEQRRPRSDDLKVSYVKDFGCEFHYKGTIADKNSAPVDVTIWTYEPPSGWPRPEVLGVIRASDGRGYFSHSPRASRHR